MSLEQWTVPAEPGVLVVPSKMNPVGEEGNMFSNLFNKVPAKRAGNEEDIASVVIYLASPAGVSDSDNYDSRCSSIDILSRLTFLLTGLH